MKKSLKNCKSRQKNHTGRHKNSKLQFNGTSTKVGTKDKPQNIKPSKKRGKKSAKI